jgi:uncharacterized protein (TIGR02996 family)
MDDEVGLIGAIRANLHDDVPRLVYADWLEERGDPRGEYLRLQCELARTWSYRDGRRDLLGRMADLRRRLDPAWLALAGRCTTPAPPVDVAAAIPELKGRAKTTVRLHPRPGTAANNASKIGGVFLWPAREEWPSCPEHRCAFVPVLQLRKEDVPEVGFEPGTGLFQVLWCPHDHEPGYCPDARLFWREEAAITDPAESHPESSEAEPDYVPRPCLLYPERVVEYPDPFELDDGFDDRIANSGELRRVLESVESPPLAVWRLPGYPGHLYQCWLSAADGTKVGGHPEWVQDPEYPSCSCGATMDLLVTFGSGEFDGASWGRWLPIEDRDVLTDAPRRRDVIEAAGWMFGDAGNMYVFLCRSCRARAVRCLMQCS